ncbi:tyrosine-type recombinase/integrase [Nostoc sp. TCL240-02]|uniref:tyrosine-type recombinase/integrase n=1 Tax=Nostoc sp. TCL240-02 TaxID=2572090 RepID=UPI00157F9DEC|nr:tyrosine-type recombinase/integrase [Nostoc sp. TCL240-02]QKQ76450.1 site-specific integrase [Nostoc sp. TCL240-02]
MALAKSRYTHLSVGAVKNEDGTFYRLRFSTALGRKTIGLSSDELQAYNIAMLVDEEVTRQLATSTEVDLDSLRELVKSELSKVKQKQGKSNIRLIEKDDLCVLWDNYVNFHVSLGQWSETYIQSHISLIRRLLESCPVTKLEQKQELVEWLFSSNTRTKQTSKDRLKLIVAAIDWNSKHGNIPRRWGIEYRDLLNGINIKQEKKVAYKDDDTQIDIFKVKEIYQILEAFRDDTLSRVSGKHRQYWRYVTFLWLTGCRPSEAVALKWDNVDLNKKRIKICEVEMVRGGQRITRASTKTVTYRFFPINNELEELLLLGSKRTGYVFVNGEGKPISHAAFYSVWGTVLKKLNLHYRVPYQLRHTMISYHANNDYPLHKLAELVGNSEEVIKEHYLRLDIERISLPGIIK